MQCGTHMVFIFSIEFLANIEVMSSISNINRLIEETLVFYVICVSHHLSNSITKDN